MKLYNTLSRTKEEFVPIEPGKVRMYSCGPTVYNFFHIGNARPFIVFDTLRRYLEYRGYSVKFVQNFTDIDDRMIQFSRNEGLTLKEFADRYIAEYWKDAEGLGIHPATVHPRATESIPEIIALIETLVAKGHAYEIDGDVYFSTRSFDGYGKLSHYNLEELESGARIDVDERKRDAVDFALWKAQKPGEPAWESPWGMGRPGWHIECSAMANQHLGETIDIHSGGLDLIFPHHENEIAQSEAASGEPFARYWLHNGFININNEKMSKSLNNFFTVRDIVQKYDYEVIRFFMLSAHYRSPINFSDDLLEAARNGLDRLYECRDNLRFLLEKAADIPETLSETGLEANSSAVLENTVSFASDTTNIVETSDFSVYRERFIAVMDDDVNTADGVAVLFDLVRDINTRIAESRKQAPTESGTVSPKVLKKALEILMELSSVLGLLTREGDALAVEVEALITQRQTARKEKNWAESDRIRDKLKEMGIELQDTPQGVKWSAGPAK